MQRNLSILAVYAALLSAAIPWYWPEDSSLFLLGVPAWVISSVVVAVLASVFTAFLLLRYPWQSDEPDE